MKVFAHLMHILSGNRQHAFQPIYIKERRK